MLDIFDLKQHVKISTHRNEHILDLVITKAGDEPVRNIRVSDPVISNHCAVRWEAPLKESLFALKNCVLLIWITSKGYQGLSYHKSL